MRSPDELRALVEDYLADLALTPELHGQADSVRYALVGGKRVRGVICLAAAEAAGTEAERALPAGAARAAPPHRQRSLPHGRRARSAPTRSR